MKIRLTLLLSALFITACSISSFYDLPDINADLALSDSSILLSTRFPTPSTVTKSIPVIVAVHGFTGSTADWKDMEDYVSSQNAVLVSRVPLGAHGVDKTTLTQSTWEQWGPPILTEYNALVALGYNNISLAANSAGAALLVQQLGAGNYDSSPPNEIFLIDPFIAPKNSWLHALKSFGFAISGEPKGVLKSLVQLTDHVRSKLKNKIQLPANTRLKVWQASGDETSDPVGALLIYRGMRQSSGGKVDAQVVDSSRHAFTNSSTDTAEKALRESVFSEFVERIQ